MTNTYSGDMLRLSPITDLAALADRISSVADRNNAIDLRNVLLAAGCDGQRVADIDPAIWAAALRVVDALHSLRWGRQAASSRPVALVGESWCMPFDGSLIDEYAREYADAQAMAAIQIWASMHRHDGDPRWKWHAYPIVDSNEVMT